MTLNIPENAWPPGGWSYRDPKTGYTELKGKEKNRVKVAQGIEQMRLNNPHVYPKAEATFEKSLLALEDFTARRLATKGLFQFVIYAPGEPFPPNMPEAVKKKLAPPPLPPRPKPVARADAKPAARPWVDKLRRLANGVSTLADWVGHGQKPVDQATAENRAVVCVACPLNNTAPDWIGRLTTSASQAMHDQMEVKAELELRTSLDSKLGVCDACLCPLALKVWTPLEFIEKHLDRDVFFELDKNCWILKEL